MRFIKYRYFDVIKIVFVKVIVIIFDILFLPDQNSIQNFVKKFIFPWLILHRTFFWLEPFHLLNPWS
jgi:hypothetical protein